MLGMQLQNDYDGWTYSKNIQPIDEAQEFWLSSDVLL
jgi:hypothetical protein